MWQQEASIPSQEFSTYTNFEKLFNCRLWGAKRLQKGSDSKPLRNEKQLSKRFFHESCPGFLPVSKHCNILYHVFLSFCTPSVCLCRYIVSHKLPDAALSGCLVSFLCLWNSGARYQETTSFGCRSSAMTDWRRKDFDIKWQDHW